MCYTGEYSREEVITQARTFVVGFLHDEISGVLENKSVKGQDVRGRLLSYLPSANVVKELDACVRTLGRME